MAIVSLNGDRMEATADRARLNQRIDAYTVKAAPVLRFDDVGAHVLETMTELARQMAEDSPGRKTVVGLGAGLAVRHADSVADRRPRPAARVDRGDARDGLRQRRALRDRSGRHRDVAVSAARTGFARLTGGHSFVNTNDVDGGSGSHPEPRRAATTC